jgi:opine dehydrogenase
MIETPKRRIVSAKPNVTICGAGSGGMAMAADLAMLGCQVNLYEIPEYSANLEPIRSKGGIKLTGLPFSGKTGLAKLNVISDDAQQALAGSELVFINVPAMGVGPFLVHLAPHFSPGQVVVVTTSYWASFRYRDLLRATGAFDKYIFAEMVIMPYLSGKTGPAEVEIGNWKREIIISAWPATGNSRALETVRAVYPHTQGCKNVLELNFRPGNPGVHAQITIPKAEFFFERARVFRFYGEVSRCASKLTDAHDVERMRVAAAYDCQTDTWPDDCRKIYDLQGEDLYELHGSVTDRHAQKWNQVEEIERLLVEDICYSFVPMEELARLVGITTPVTAAMTDLLAVFTGYDYRANGLKLNDLGLEGMSREQIIKYATTGCA